MYRWLVDTLAFKRGISDGRVLVAIIFWSCFVISVIIGTVEATQKDHCTIERIAELHPGYLTGCIIFGKSIPSFTIFGDKK